MISAENELFAIQRKELILRPQISKERVTLLRLHLWLPLILVLSASLQGAASFFPSVTRSAILKTTARSAPSILFQTTWGGSNYDGALGVAHDGSGNIYVTGNTYSFCCGSPDAFLLKFNPTGSLLWQRAWPSNVSSPSFSASGNALAVDAAGNAYVTGYVVTNSSSRSQDVMLLKFDANGDLLWQRSWGGAGNEEGLGIALGPSGGVYVTGFTYSPLPGFGTEKVFVLKFGSNGSLMWQEVWGWTNGYNSAAGIAVDPSGNVFVSGSFRPVGFGYPTNPVLLKLNSTGALQWQETWRGNGYISDFNAMTLYVDSSGNAYLTGSVNGVISGSLVRGIPIMKFDPNGTIIWQKVCSVLGYSDGLVLDASGNIFLTGSGGLLLLELSSGGDLEWEAGASNLGTGGGVIVDSAGDPIVVGSATAGPPYTLTELGYPVVTDNYTPETALGLVDTPSISALSLNLSILTPPGSQTYSGQAEAFILSVEPPQQFRPSPPLALIAEAGEDNISLSWAPPEFNGGSAVAGYHVYRGESSGSELPLANTSSVHSYLDTNVRHGFTYYYYVKAANALGESDASNEAHATAGVMPRLTGFVPSDSTLLVGTSIALAAVAAFVFYRRRKSVIRSSTTSLFER